MFTECKILGEENGYRLHKDVTFFCYLKNDVDYLTFYFLVVHAIFGNTRDVHHNMKLGCEMGLVIGWVWSGDSSGANSRVCKGNGKFKMELSKDFRLLCCESWIKMIFHTQNV